ncbi:C69 family dipeptidase [Mesosutterella sp. OilRF-GAM-744-9]|uniref:Dipeptidase n=1 Tax=Mesosutterella porci TaxID=2915351 RepID=A0ABS9MRX3_9BURK|nr:C69 family dipeptidase [Mesosutterella sp. oilRF-744-WT-GAM-9]MCG5031383.1 C69 family dipeptidase [Mesosutterella sp. oilRF-744-WT-GAM-9]
MPCTTILAGSGATADHSLIIARNEDCAPDDAKRLLWHPAQKACPGRVFRSFRNDFAAPFEAAPLGYQSVSDSATDGASEGEAGFNEAGVGITATETIFASAASLALDPYLPLSGVVEDMIEDYVLPLSHSAREGVRILGRAIEEHGAGEGCGVAFMDESEVWWFETCCAHQWAAARLPKECCYVTANHARLREFDPQDTENFLSSPGLVSFAEEHGLWPAGKRPFDVRAAYVDEKPSDLYYNYPRNRVLIEKYRGGTPLRSEDDPDFPIFFRPARPLTMLDVAAGLRNRFEGTDSDPYASGNPRVKARPISVFRCSHSHILVRKPWLPLSVGAVSWVSWGMPSLSVFVPFFEGFRDVPQAYRIGTHDADGKSAGWAFRKPQTLAMMDYGRLEPVVRRVWDRWERQALRKTALIEARYCDLLALKGEAASDLYLERENTALLEDALRQAKALENELMTLLTRSVSARFPFNGA